MWDEKSQWKRKRGYACATNGDERSRKEWGCSRGVRGTRKGERDAACVGMDQCVNGCCLTRTAEIIVSGTDGYFQRRLWLPKHASLLGFSASYLGIPRVTGTFQDILRTFGNFADFQTPWRWELFRVEVCWIISVSLVGFWCTSFGG